MSMAIKRCLNWNIRRPTVELLNLIGSAAFEDRAFQERQSLYDKLTDSAGHLALKQVMCTAWPALADNPP